MPLSCHSQTRIMDDFKKYYIRIKERKERTHVFTAVFPAINHWFEKTVVETGDEFSIIYIFINLFVNKV